MLNKLVMDNRECRCAAWPGGLWTLPRLVASLYVIAGAISLATSLGRTFATQLGKMMLMFPVSCLLRGSCCIGLRSFRHRLARELTGNWYMVVYTILHLSIISYILFALMCESHERLRSRPSGPLAPRPKSSWPWSCRRSWRRLTCVRMK